ncbi:hypothetical protein RSOLAG22IIIB_09736 [Rhizoctonia solani]|uniref:HAT C-terminal dimerisation domain-containing protein n=1 Tax=Rhizoctonia solani TaxID=456999 RepID=A0A0K6FZV5_9AGAM|nr:hypothetical protein RSOLAG22IIIB_09736 [Rhizoctonia solani]
MNVIEKDELRGLLIYCGQGRIQDKDIPHRDKLTTAAWAMYLLEKEKIDNEMKEQAQEAELILKREMLRMHRALSRSQEANGSAANATRAQLSGYMRLLTRNSGANFTRGSKRVRQEEGNSAEGDRESPSNNPPALGLHTPPSAPPNPFASIEDEFVRYMSAGTTTFTTQSQLGVVELVNYWKAHQYTYPMLYRIAMNIPPAQASSVSSERVFSSSKMTCTSERSRLSSESMEFLQVLKHSLFHHRRTREEALSQDDGIFDFVTHEFAKLEISADTATDDDYVLVN